MALIDCEMGIGRLPSQGRTFLSGLFAGRPAAASKPADVAAAQALASIGFLAMLLLPALLIASLLAEAPVAVPSILALGFMFVARAVTAGRPRQAEGWMASIVVAMVVSALLAWVLLDSPRAGVMTSALVAVFAAAPALMQKFRVPAARLTLRSTPARMGDHNAKDREPSEAPDLAADAFHGSVQAPGSAYQCPLFAATEPRRPDPVEPVGLAEPHISSAASDPAEAIDFALRLLAPEAGRRGIRLLSEGHRGASVAVDRQDLRLIVHRSIAAALADARPGAEICLTLRALRGAVLVRVIRDEAEGDDSDMPRPCDALQSTQLGALVAAAAGTILSDRRPAGLTLSIRLPRAAAAETAWATGRDAA